MIFGYIFFIMLQYLFLFLRCENNLKQNYMASLRQCSGVRTPWLGVLTVHSGAHCDSQYIRMKQTFSKSCHEWETGMEFASSGRHYTSESATYIRNIFWLPLPRPYFLLVSDKILQSHQPTLAKLVIIS